MRNHFGPHSSCNPLVNSSASGHLARWQNPSRKERSSGIRFAELLSVKHKEAVSRPFLEGGWLRAGLPQNEVGTNVVLLRSRSTNRGPEIPPFPGGGVAWAGEPLLCVCVYVLVAKPRVISYRELPATFLPKFRRVTLTPDPDTFQIYRDTPPISIAIVL